MFPPDEKGLRRRDAPKLHRGTWTVNRRAKAWITFSRLDLWLPRMFIGLYTLYAVGLVAGAAVDPR